MSKKFSFQMIVCLFVILFAFSANAKPFARICGGPEGDIHHEIAEYLQEALSHHFVTEAISTSGSMENLSRDDCDISVAQGDIIYLHRREEPKASENRKIFDSNGLFKESLHLLCHRDLPIFNFYDVVDKSDHVHPPTVYIAGEKSSSAMTWRSLVKLDPKLAKVDVQFVRTPSPELHSTVAKNASLSNQNSCFFFVSRIPNLTLEYLSNTRTWSESFRLVNFNNHPATDHWDFQQGNIYKYQDIPRNYYANFRVAQPKAQNNIGRANGTLELKTHIVFNKNWYQENIANANSTTRESVLQILGRTKLFLGPGPQRPSWWDRTTSHAAGFRYGRLKQIAKNQVDHFGWVSAFVPTNEISLITGITGNQGFWHKGSNRQTVFVQGGEAHRDHPEFSRRFFENPWVGEVSGKIFNRIRGLENSEVYVQYTQDLISVQGWLRNTEFRVRDFGLVGGPIKLTSLKCYSVSPWWWSQFFINQRQRVVVRDAKIVEVKYQGNFVNTYEMVLQVAENSYVPVSINDRGLFEYAIQNLADHNTVRVEYLVRGGADFPIFNKTINLAFMIQPVQPGAPILDMEACRELY